jgi:hypothetical protein
MVETDASVEGELILLVTMIGLLYQVKRDGWKAFHRVLRLVFDSAQDFYTLLIGDGYNYPLISGYKVRNRRLHG